MNLTMPFSILLVEDDECTSELLTSLLAIKFPAAGISSAEDGVSGLELLHRQPIDIVITDINMPKMDGVRLISGIAACRPDTRIIVITAHSDRQILDRISATGVAVEVVPKPVSFDVLMAAIERCAAAC